MVRFWCKLWIRFWWLAIIAGMAVGLRAPDLFKGWHFDREIIVLCVRWYLSFKLSSRDRKCQDSGPGRGGASRFGIVKCHSGTHGLPSLPISRTPEPESPYRTWL